MDNNYNGNQNNDQNGSQNNSSENTNQANVNQTANDTQNTQNAADNAKLNETASTAANDQTAQQAQAQTQSAQPQQPNTQQGAQPNGEYSYNYQNAQSQQQSQQSQQYQQPQTQNTYQQYQASNGYSNPYHSQQSQQTGGYSQQSTAYERPIYDKPKKQKAKNGLSGKVVALVVCCCLICSAVFGVGGAFVATSLIKSDSTSSSSGSSSASNGSGLSYQAVPSETSGTVDSDNAIVLASNKAKASVVEISTETVSTSSFFGQYVTQGAGSGVIISSDGYIITCAHVISGATSVTVMTSDGTKYEATVVGEDDQTDIAVVKIDATGLTPAVIGSSGDLLVGETAIAIGNPLGELGGTVTTGIISALDREITIDGQNYKLLQTNAAINPGNSGGGLFNINGELIGVVNAKSSGSEIEGLGFAIPIDTAVDIANQLIANGYISGRAMLGVNIYEVTTSTSASTLLQSGLSNLLNYITDYGVYFVSYSDAQTGDLQFGDRIVAIDGVTVSSLSDIKSMLTEYSVGDSIKITVARLETDGRTSKSKMVEVDLTLLENVPTTASTDASAN